MSGKSLLIDGNIPAGQACPWLGQCDLRVDRCPTRRNPKIKAYSCGAARLFDVFEKKPDPDFAHRESVGATPETLCTPGILTAACVSR